MIVSFLGVFEYIFIPWLSMSLLVFILICYIYFYYYIRGEGEAFNDSPASRNHSDLICREETSFLFDSVRCCFHLISTQLNLF